MFDIGKIMDMAPKMEKFAADIMAWAGRMEAEQKAQSDMLEKIWDKLDKQQEQISTLIREVR